MDKFELLLQWNQHVYTTCIPEDADTAHIARITMGAMGFELTVSMRQLALSKTKIFSYTMFESMSLEQLKGETDKFIRGLHLEYVQILNIGKNRECARHG